MPWAAVIGSPISHSLSPVLHRAAWDSLGLGEEWEYLRLEQTPETLPALVASLDANCAGLSVTMPCKQAVMPLLDAIDPLAEAVGSTNTVVPAGPVLTGFNTDVHGIQRAVTEARGAAGLGAIRSAVVLGARATASSALAALGTLTPSTSRWSRVTSPVPAPWRRPRPVWASRWRWCRGPGWTPCGR